MNTSILKISDAASLALHTMVYLAKNPDRMVSTREIAGALDVSENHLAKVRQRLAKAGLVDAARGPGGGFRLASDPENTTLLQIYETIEGTFKPVSCLLRKPACTGETCILGGMIASVNEQFLEYLQTTALAALV